MSPKNKKVYVGLSGGVDSSVSAFLLKKAGHDVTGVFIKAWYPDFIDCNWREEMRDAMRICAQLDIPFKICDLEAEYKKNVVDYLIKEYKEGRTPNPDVICNKYIKFDGFLKFALRNGADFIATGHYAQNIWRTENDKSAAFHLEKAKDPSKDQTYFLWTLNQKQLEKVLFPIGHLNKSKVRQIAKKNQMFTAFKKDSQGLCFLGHVDIENFLSHYLKTKPGKVINKAGETIGTHHGALFYTIGQRHGFNIDENATSREKYYVLSKNVRENILIVAPGKKKEDSKIKSRYNLKDLNLINNVSKNLTAQYRYHGDFKKINLKVKSKNLAEIDFVNLSENLASGQSIVIYQDDECLGGGIIV